MKERYAFISYAHADYKLIRDDILSIAREHAIWLDKAKLIAGDRFDDEIKQSIEGSSAFILFLTMNYGDSAYCLKEIRMAKKYGKPVCVIYKDDMENISDATYGEKILEEVEDLHQILEDNGRSIQDEVNSFASKYDLTSRDCTEGKPESFFPKYNPVFVVPEQRATQYTYNYMPDGKNLLSLIGRDKEMKILQRFLDNEDGKTWCMLVGPGGSGKSRLCLELAETMHEREWDVCFLEDHIDSGDKRTNRLERLKRKQTNDRLIIIDYAVTHSQKVSEFLHHINTHPSSVFKTRVILVDREMNENSTSRNREEYTDTTKYFFFVSEYKKELEDSRYGALPLFSLDPLSPSSLQQVLIQYAEKAMNKKMSLKVAKSLQKKLSTDIDPHMQRPLYAIFMAEAWANNDNPADWKRNTALEHVLNRETGIWLKKAEINGNPSSAAYFSNAMIAISAKATFRGDIPLTTLKEEGPENVSIITNYLASPKSSKFTDYLDEIGWIKTTNNDKQILAFRPDLLGEFIVLNYMKENQETISSLFPPNWHLDSNIHTFLSNIYHDFKFELFKYPGFWDTLLEPECSNELEALIYIQLLRQFMDSNNITITLRIVEKLEQLITFVSNPRLQSIILDDIGKAYQFIDNTSKALEIFERNMEIRSGLQETKNTVEARRNFSVSLNRIGDAYTCQGKIDKALEFFERSLEIRRAIMQETGTVDARRDYGFSLERLGDTYRHLGNPDDALKFHKRSMEFMHDLEKKTRTVEASQDLMISCARVGGIYMDLKNPLEAIRCYNRELKIARLLRKITQTIDSKRSLGVAYQNLGEAYVVLSSPLKALEFFKKSLEIGRDLEAAIGTVKAGHELTVSLKGLGDAYVGLGELEKAMGFYEESLKIDESVEEAMGTVDARFDLFVSLLKLGDAYTHLKQPEKALEYYEKSLEIIRGLEKEMGTVAAKFDLGMCIDRLGITYASLKDLDKAIDYYNRELEILKFLLEKNSTINIKQALSNAYVKLGDTHYGLGNPSKSLEFFEESRKILEELSSISQTPETQEDLAICYSRLSTAEKEPEIKAKYFIL